MRQLEEKKENSLVYQSTSLLSVSNALFIQTPTMKQKYLLKDFLETLGRKQCSFHN